MVMESLFQRMMLLFVIFALHTGFCAGENVSVHFHASGVILNHNFTKEFYMKDKKDCEPCQNLADDVQTGFWKMFDFFVGVNLFVRVKNSSLLNKTSEGVFFRPPSLGGLEINTTENPQIPPDEQKEEMGIYFIMVMRLDLNVTDPSRNLYDLNVLIQNSCWLFLRGVVHFQLHQDVLLNSKVFNFQEIPESQVSGYLKLLRQQPEDNQNNNNNNNNNNNYNNNNNNNNCKCNSQNLLAAESFVGFYLPAVGVALMIMKKDF